MAKAQTIRQKKKKTAFTCATICGTSTNSEIKQIKTALTTLTLKKLSTSAIIIQNADQNRRAG